jgi:hypothetical protein
MKRPRRGSYVALGAALGLVFGFLTYAFALEWKLDGQLPVALLVSLGVAALMGGLAWLLGEKFLDWLGMFPHW